MRKLPNDEKVTELLQSHTQAEVARMFGCSRQRVEQIVRKLHLDPPSPLDVKIGRIGKENLWREINETNINQVVKKHHISYAKLIELFPDAPRKQGCRISPNHRRKLPDMEIIRELYQTMEAADIAKMYNCVPGTVRVAIHRYGLQKRRYVPLDELKQELLQFIEELGIPGEMPTVKEFRDNGKKKLLGRLYHVSNLAQVAQEMSLTMRGRWNGTHR